MSKVLIATIVFVSSLAFIQLTNSESRVFKLFQFVDTNVNLITLLIIPLVLLIIKWLDEPVRLKRTKLGTLSFRAKFRR